MAQEFRRRQGSGAAWAQGVGWCGRATWCARRAAATGPASAARTASRRQALPEPVRDRLERIKMNATGKNTWVIKNADGVAGASVSISSSGAEREEPVAPPPAPEREIQ